jgi:5'-nucleotidase / UDP-sugar diphosphatase
VWRILGGINLESQMKNRLFSALGLGLLATSTLLASPVSFTLLHMNDMHARFLPREAKWSKQDPKPFYGGVVAMQAAVAHERQGLESVLVVDAGDWLTGTPLSDMVYEGVKGGPFIEMMNGLGLDCSTIGNHEFDNGVDNIPAMIKLSNFDVVSANLLRHGELMAPKPYEIYERGELRIGVIGLILDGLAHDVGGLQEMNVSVLDVAETAQKMIDEIDERTDVILLLTHQGFRADSLLATKVHDCDLIVGGHSHSRLRHPVEVNGIKVLQAGCYAGDLGRVDMQVEDDRLVACEGKLIPLYIDKYEADPVFAEMVAGYKAEIDAIWNQTIAHIDAPCTRSYFNESPLGNLLSDVVCQIAGADIGLLNSGGLRTDLPGGAVRKLDIKQILPFDNHLMTLELSGAQILDFLRHNAAVSASEEHGILQMGGLECSYRVEAFEGGSKVTLEKTLIQGKKIEPHATYKVVTVDYVLGQSGKYFGFETPENTVMGGQLAMEVIRYLELHPQLSAPKLDRFKRLN